MRSLFLLFIFFSIGVSAYLLVGSIFHEQLSEKNERYEYDRPGEADRFFYEQRMYPNNMIPSDWYQSARAHISRMPGHNLSKAVTPWNWVSLGPTNIAGRIRAMAMDPNDPNTLYAGSAGGGVWKTTDGGKSWRALTDFLPNLRIGSIAVSPHDSKTVLAGNGEGFVIWQDNLAYGRGIYRSDDHGATWNVVPSTQNQNFEFVFDVAFDPFDPNVILASTKVGTMRSTDGGEQWTRMKLTFAQIRGMVSVFSRTTDGLVYSAIEGYGVYRSEDHGATWTGPLTNGIQIGQFSRTQLSTAPSNGDIVYAAFTAADESCAGVFKTTDRGATWKRITTPLNEIDGDTYMREQGQYNSVLAVHPTNPDIIWAGGIDLYRSTNGGNSWKQMTNWYSLVGYSFVHADQHAFLFNPQNPQQLFIGCDGGVYRSTNGGSSFIDSNTGLITVQFHSGTPHPTSDIILGGTIDNGTLRITTGTNWTEAAGGDGGYTAIDYNDPRTMYAEIYYLEFLKSSSFGSPGTFVRKMNGIPKSQDGGTTDRCAFLAPFEMDSNNPRTIYAGTYRIYRTTNGADQWTTISQDLTGGTGYITAIGLAKSSGSVIYTGASTGRVSVTTNSGTDWKAITTGLPNRYITDIAVDVNDPATAYLTVSGFGTGHLFKTTNYGANWTNSSGSGAQSLPDVPANTVVIHPTNPQRIFVGTDVGVFITYDGGMTWMINNEGMGNVTVADLQFRKDGILFAATHGRGAFKSDFSLLDSHRIPQAVDFIIEQNFPNPFSLEQHGTTTIGYSIENASSAILEVFDLTGKKIRVENLGLKSPGRYFHAFDAKELSVGLYFYRMIVNGTVSNTMKMVLIN